MEILPDSQWGRNFSDKIKFHLYRILQESLTNIFKHSEADRVLIQLKYSGDYISLYVEDNGKGFKKENVKGLSKGLGLENIRLRTELLNGQLKIQTNSGGTIIEIKIPTLQKEKAVKDN